jgi:RNA-directed DNA polymerase
MSEPRLPGKSHDIPKRLIWAAWLKVKSNGGAAGADGVTIEQFEVRAPRKVVSAGHGPVLDC